MMLKLPQSFGNMNRFNRIIMMDRTSVFRPRSLGSIANFHNQRIKCSPVVTRKLCTANNLSLWQPLKINMRRFSTDNTVGNKKIAVVKTESVGIRFFLTKVNIKACFGVLSSVGVSLLAFSLCNESSVVSLGFAGYGLTCVAVGYICLKHYMLPKFKSFRKNKEVIYYSVNKPMREACFWMTTSGSGMFATPFLIVAASVSPFIIPLSICLSAVIVSGCTLLLARWNHSTVVRQLGASIALVTFIYIAIHLIVFISIPFYGISEWLLNAGRFFGIGDFILRSVCNGHYTRSMYWNRKADHLLCALEMFLAFFICWLNIVALLLSGFVGFKIKADDKKSAFVCRK